MRFCLLRDFLAEDMDRMGDLASVCGFGRAEHADGDILEHARAAGHWSAGTAQSPHVNAS